MFDVLLVRVDVPVCDLFAHPTESQLVQANEVALRGDRICGLRVDSYLFLLSKRHVVS